MHILITGGGGFIGRAVKQYAEQIGHTVSVLDRPLDVRRPDHLDTFVNVDRVIHLAGVLGTHELFDTPHLAVDVNVQGSLNVLEYCRRTGAGYTGITMPQVFPSIYTATKIASTALASAYNHTLGVPVSHVRAFNAFGPGQAHGPDHPQKIIPTFAYNAWRGIPIPVWGDGEQGVDLIHTSDLARMLVDATAFDDNQTFDGGTGEMWTVNETVELVNSIVTERGGPGAPINYKPMRRGEEPTQIVAIGEGWNGLGWRPEFRMSDLVEAVEFYRDYVV
jgi:UDP-glucose 4-epimerase